MYSCVKLYVQCAVCNSEPFHLYSMYIRIYRIYVKDSIVKSMTMLPAIQRTYLPWMAPHVDQTRLATNHVNEPIRCLDTATLTLEHDVAYSHARAEPPGTQ